MLALRRSDDHIAAKLIVALVLAKAQHLAVERHRLHLVVGRVLQLKVRVGCVGYVEGHPKLGLARRPVARARADP
eukprot:4164420-Prymnesium_polylepis.2